MLGHWAHFAIRESVWLTMTTMLVTVTRNFWKRQQQGSSVSLAQLLLARQPAILSRNGVINYFRTEMAIERSCFLRGCLLERSGSHRIVVLNRSCGMLNRYGTAGRRIHVRCSGGFVWRRGDLNVGFLFTAGFAVLERLFRWPFLTGSHFEEGDGNDHKSLSPTTAFETRESPRITKIRLLEA